MNSPQSSPEPDRSLPSGIPAPPPPRPPDIKDPRDQGATYGGTEKKKKKKGERTHPTDPYPKLKKRSGCCGCLGSLFVSVLLVAITLAVLIGYFGPGRFVKEGYKVVNLRDQNASVTTAPSEATLYIAPGSLTWDVTVTEVPVAIIAREITVSGDFHEMASLNAVKVTGTERARFAKDLEIYTAEFTDKGITLKGALKGRVVKNLQ